MIYINKVIVCGKLAGDAESIATKSGKPMSKVVVDTPTGFGEQKKTSHIIVKAFGKTAEILNQYGKAGKVTSIEGIITSEEFKTQDGRTFSNIVVVADKVSFESSSQPSQSTQQKAVYPAKQPVAQTKRYPSKQQNSYAPQEEQEEPQQELEEEQTQQRQNNFDDDVPF
jgi:single-strand DNA-binding protein